MKIVCEACQAKYSISDDKVRGKAFKIRCKKCSHIIVVRATGAMDAVGGGEPQAASPAPAPVPAAGGGAATWHIVVDGEQVGPLADSDIRARLSRGEISGDTYIWREGLPDWQKISAVAEFADAAAGAGYDDGQNFGQPAPTTVYPPGTSEAAFAPPVAAAPAEPDVFAAPTVVAAGASADLFASPVSAAAPAAQPAAASFAFGGALAAEPAPARASGNGASPSVGVGGLTGQRHENSVLFSLSNLEALAQPSAPSSAAPRPGVSGPSEGSGLIDIRSMAAVTLGSKSDGPRASNDLPAFDVPQFSPVAPVLLPIAPASSGPPKWLYAVLGVLVLLAGGLGIATYKVFTARPVVQAPAPAPVVSQVPVEPAPAAQPAAPPTTPPPANEPLPPREEARPSERASDRTASRGGARGGRDSRKPSGGSKPAESAPTVAVSAPAPAPAKPPAAAELSGKRDRLDDLLDSALGNRPKPAAPREEEAPKKPAAATAALPTLQRGDIVNVMKPVTAKVKDCYNQYKVPGTAMVNFSVGEGGKLNSVSVTGKFAGTPTGACVEAAAKSAKFPACAAINFPYPFALQ